MEEGDRRRGVPLAAVGRHQPGVVLFAATAKIFAGKQDCQNGEGEKDVNQSSTTELSCFMCWRNRVPAGWQADVLVSVPALWIRILC